MILGNARVRFNTGQQEGKGDGERGRKSWSWPRPCHLSRAPSSKGFRFITLSIDHSSCPVEGEEAETQGEGDMRFFLGWVLIFMLPTSMSSLTSMPPSCRRHGCFLIMLMGSPLMPEVSPSMLSVSGFTLTWLFFYAALSLAYAPWARWDGNAGLYANLTFSLQRLYRCLKRILRNNAVANFFGRSISSMTSLVRCLPVRIVRRTKPACFFCAAAPAATSLDINKLYKLQKN